MVEMLEFSIGGYFSGVRNVKVWIEEGKMFKSYKGDFRDPEAVYTEEVSDEERKIFEGKLVDCDLLKWKKDYFNPNIMDGTQWVINIKDSDRKQIKHISGSNDYPVEWNNFIRALAVLIPEIVNEVIEKRMID